MFLEPDAKGRQKSSGSVFFHAQSPIVSPRDVSSLGRRQYLPFIERTPSEVNQQNQKVQQIQQVEEVPDLTPLKPTVRLIRPSPEPSYNNEKENIPFGRESKDTSQAGERVPLSSTGILTPASLRPESQKPTLAAQRVSGVHALPKPGRDSLLSSLYTTNQPSRAEWHRRSGSSGNYSNISTLHGESVTGPKSVRTQSTASQGTTLRGTPTPSERESSDRSAYDTNSGQWSLQPLHETSPRPSTVRIISTPPHSIYSDNWEHSGSSEPAATTQLWSSPTEAESVASFAQRLSRRTSSTGSLPSPRQSLRYSSPPRRRSQGSIDRPDSEVLSSSPNFVSYNDSSPSRPQRYRLYRATSVESISSRLQTPKIVRIESGRSFATTVNVSSPSSSPTEHTPPPELEIPKNQLRHKPASSALHAAAAASAVPDEEAMADEEVDTLPYPRQPFRGHLSTIASESDARSRVTSQQLSHFSIGSGVTTGDEASIIASTASPRRLPMSFVQQLSDSSSSGSGAAWPQPLFHARTPSAPQHPLPPIPPIPGSPDSQEGFDTVPELTAPRQLREQRSGYSLRHRSHSTPSRSRSLSQTSEASRHSHVANIFPTWAKAYYTYGAPLLSSSQISLALPIDPQRMQNIHQVLYNSRDWSDRSTISRLGSVSEISSFEAVSPISNRFLPNIWRPRNRKRSVTGIIRHIKTISTSQPSEPSQPSMSPPESMVIMPAPLERDAHPLPLPEEQRYGHLNDTPESQRHRPLPKRYSKQKHWNNMQFPRPMSKDDFHDIEGGREGNIDDGPHLAPSRRLGQRLSAWGAPSFAESLDTLLHSRCNRQILFFALGFLCPLSWIVASFLALPKKPMREEEFERTSRMLSSEDVTVAVMKHEAGDAEQRWREERTWLKARWWRYLNRIMSVIGVLFIAAVIALVVVATHA